MTTATGMTDRREVTANFTKTEGRKHTHRPRQVWGQPEGKGRGRGGGDAKRHCLGLWEQVPWADDV